LLGEMSGYACG